MVVALQRLSVKNVAFLVTCLLLCLLHHFVTVINGHLQNFFPEFLVSYQGSMQVLAFIPLSLPPKRNFVKYVVPKKFFFAGVSEIF